MERKKEGRIRTAATSSISNEQGEEREADGLWHMLPLALEHGGEYSGS
jgi:hypothetical protein